MKTTVLIIFCFFTSLGEACQCMLTNLSKQECSKYEIIFRGKIKEVVSCNNKPGEAIFEVLDLFKGAASKKIMVMFDCNDPCAIGFKEGEEWIIYSRYRQVNKAMMDWCSRSRKFIGNQKQDFYAVTYGNSYDEELKFLNDSLGLHRLLKEEPLTNADRNKRPTVNQSIVMLILSLVSIVVFYYLFNKFFK